MIVYRLSKSKFSNDLSGKGAEKSGGRWNSKGTAFVYTGQSRALCTTEIAVHTPLGILPNDYELIELEIDDSIEISEIDIRILSKKWKVFPHAHETQVIGDKFVDENKYLVLKVPSVVVQGEFNYLINPNHPEISNVKIKTIEKFNFDERLFLK